MGEKKHKYLISVVGPTAIGKTSLAIEIAKELECEIISCDSRQFFKEMTIGTAVPSPEELSAVKHHFIHNKTIFEDYTVGEFEKEAMDKIIELHKTSDYVVMVGGSGLYVDAVLKGFDDFPEIDPAVRIAITAKYQKHGLTWLQEQLQELDPVYYATVVKQNPQRLMRALEVTIGSGKPYSSFLNIKKNSRPFVSIIIGLEGDRKVIYERIESRVDRMLEDGLVEEAKALFEHRNLNALQTVGYKELFSYFAEDFSFDFAIYQIKKNTRRFAKRLLTWFRKNPEVKWFDFMSSSEEILKYIRKAIKKSL